MKSFVFASSLTAGIVLASTASATSIEQVPQQGAPQVAVDITQMFGAAAPVPQGYSGFLVRVQNNEQQPVRGEVELESRLYSNQFRYRATAPFVVGAGAAAMVRLPAHANVYGDVKIVVRNDAGIELGTLGATVTNSPGVFLLDVTEASRLRGVMHEAWISPQYAPWGSVPSYGSGPQLQVGSPRFDPATGDPVLPDRAALYAPASAVLIRSDVLSRVTAVELDALSGFVLAGGTLAVALARPEDVRSPVVAAFAGGDVTMASVHSETLRELRLPIAPSNAAKKIPFAESAEEEVGKSLVGFSGGNLRGSRYGASAYYGLGEFHLLAFDPTRKPAVDDPWVQGRVLDMARRAFDRRSTIIYRQGSTPAGYSSDGIRKQLDPNEGSRWAIAVAALLLLAYAVIAAPINFTLNANKGKPLRALIWLPIFAAVTFFAIVVIGFVAKGVSGRSRHLTLVEAGAGMSKGTARRWRGFFTPRAKDLTVRTSDSTSVVNTAFVSAPATINDHLVVDRDGARLVDVAALPWQTVVIREDGFADLGEGIAIVTENETDTAVINRSGRDMRAALLMLPGGNARYFATIRDGERVLASAGQDVGSTKPGRAWLTSVTATVGRSGSLTMQPLRASSLERIVDDDAAGLSAAWQAIEESAGGVVNWFPEDVPVLLAQLDGGEGKTSDAGLKLEQDRLLVRIVGQGGRP
ncbi:MAG: hypothetical protein IPM54_32815 [Polyangiaceae bacterium]|nr:hypothetical protein [Polyangiaceae bacterium]